MSSVFCSGWRLAGLMPNSFRRNCKNFFNLPLPLSGRLTSLGSKCSQESTSSLAPSKGLCTLSPNSAQAHPTGLPRPPLCDQEALVTMPETGLKVLLGIIFFFIISPIALLFRTIGIDLLSLKRNAGKQTHWHSRPSKLRL